MEKFAGYGFNKSHAAAYALLSYYTAYLKAHHPAAFMAANMSLAMDDTDKVKILVEDSLDICGLKLLPPDINLSDYRFKPVGEPGKPAKQIRYGLGAIKGSGQGAIENIIAAREKGGPFTDLFDFVKRVDKRQVNRRTIEAMIRGGAFDCLKVDRGILLASVGFAMECAEQAEASANQNSLFGDDDVGTLGNHEYVKVPPWSEKQRLTEEKLALGFYLSGHLFNAYAPEVRRFARTRLADLQPSRDPRIMAGVIASTRTQMTQRGRMLVVTLDDGSALVEVTVFSELVDANRNLFKEDEFLCVQGKVSEDRFTGGLRITAEKVMDIAGVRQQYARRVIVALTQPVDKAAVQEVLAPYRNQQGLPFVLHYQRENTSCEIEFGQDWRVAPGDNMAAQLKQKLGADGFEVEYK
jgi:DNA polymerase III subunit alpha